MFLPIIIEPRLIIPIMEVILLQVLAVEDILPGIIWIEIGKEEEKLIDIDRDLVQDLDQDPLLPLEEIEKLGIGIEIEIEIEGETEDPILDPQNHLLLPVVPTLPMQREERDHRKRGMIRRGKRKGERNRRRTSQMEKKQKQFLLPVL